MSRHERVLRVSERAYRVLLRAYPEELRREYGLHLAQVFRDMCREEERRGGGFGLVRLWGRVLLDLAATMSLERSKAMKWKFLMPLALVLGLLIALVDSRPNWDDTGVTAAVIFVCCGILGAAHPSRAWQWTLAVGLWVPALGITHANYGSILALAFALAGAYAGKLVRFVATGTQT